MDRLKGLICRSDSISEWSGGKDYFRKGHK